MGNMVRQRMLVKQAQVTSLVHTQIGQSMTSLVHTNQPIINQLNELSLNTSD